MTTVIKKKFLLTNVLIQVDDLFIFIFKTNLIKITSVEYDLHNIFNRNYNYIS